MKARRPWRCALSFVWLVLLLVVAHDAAAGPAKRKVPDYDGRGPEPTTAGDVLLWVPRVLLSPFYFVSEFLIRRPLAFVIGGAERAHLPEVLYNIFAFGPDHKAGFFPIALVDFGFRPSVGVYVFWDDAFVKGNDLRLRGSTWGEDWLAGALIDRVHLGKNDLVTFNVRAIRRPDYAFFGLGPRTLQADRSRYGADTVDASVMFDVRPVWFTRLQAGSGLRTASFRPGRFDDDPSITQQAARGIFPLPDGYETGYTAEYNRLLFAVDTRHTRPESGSGFRVELEAEQGSNLRRTPLSGWIRYGATAGAYYDFGRGRVINLSAGVRFVDPLGSQPIPFTELVSLGGVAPFRGYVPGRLLDRSAATATLRYRWPIWAILDGSMQVSAGNVYGTHLHAFDPALTRFTASIGVESVGSPDSSFEVLIGAGTETIEQGGAITSFRLVFGSNRGF